MSKILTVAGREFLETVKTKTFFISCVLLPMIMLLMIFGTEWIAETASQETIPTRTFAVVDQTGLVFDVLAEMVEQDNQRVPNRKFALERVPVEQGNVETLRQRALDGDVYAYLIIPPDVLSLEVLREAATSAPAASGPFGQPGEAFYCELGRKDSNPEITERLKRLLNTALIRVRFETADPPIDFDAVRLLQQRTGFLSVDVATGQETVGDDAIAFITPFAFMFLLFMGTMTISQGLLTSVIEEKSSRVVEVLLSAVQPHPTDGRQDHRPGWRGGRCSWGFGGAIGYFGAQARGRGLSCVDLPADVFGALFRARIPLHVGVPGRDWRRLQYSEGSPVHGGPADPAHHYPGDALVADHVEPLFHDQHCAELHSAHHAGSDDPACLRRSGHTALRCDRDATAFVAFGCGDDLGGGEDLPYRCAHVRQAADPLRTATLAALRIILSVVTCGCFTHSTIVIR